MKRFHQHIASLDEAKLDEAPKLKGSTPKGSGSIKSILGKDGKVYDIMIGLNGRKIEFKVQDTRDVSFKTISIKQAAKLFEGFEDMFEEATAKWRND